MASESGVLEIKPMDQFIITPLFSEGDLQWYTFTNQSLGDINNLGECSPLNILWTINGTDISDDWTLISGQFGDENTSGSDTLIIKFHNPDTYNIELIVSSCSIDLLPDSIVELS